MGLGFLPFEKIPIFIWGFILMLVGGFLLFNEEFFSWQQAKASLIIIAGICAFIYDLKKRHSAKLEKKERGNVG